MANKLLDRFLKPKPREGSEISWLRSVIAGSLYRISDTRGDTSFADIQTKIKTMRALATDSQISTALSYYATDATTPNTAGEIIWATAVDKNSEEVAELVNSLFRRWNVTSYARDHILELATIGNLYIPTTIMYSEDSGTYSRTAVALNNNTIPDMEYDIIPSTKVPPETIVHLWKMGSPCGFVCTPDEKSYEADILPEEACIHFSLGGLLGDYSIDMRDPDGETITYDIQFADPLMEKAVQPTQTLGLLEDALVLSSLIRTVKFINVRCGREEDEIREALQQIKDAIEQQLSLNTLTGDAQSYVNPQSPNNLIYLPFVDDQEAISITDLNMAETNDTDNKLLQYYQDKKLSVLGVPKEAMNFSSNEGLGGAGQVMSQRSALYANSLSRLETAYIAGWTDALNKYFTQRNMSGFVGKFKLHMNPIVTVQSTVQFEKRDSALSQATTLVQLLKDAGVTDGKTYNKALVEILSEVFPQMGADAMTWGVDVTDGGDGDAI